MVDSTPEPQTPSVPDGLASWGDFETAEPQFAAAVRARFEFTKHHVLATLRRDGSPRVSGTEVTISDGELMLGSMLNAMKALDLIRDGRFALHSNPGDSSMVGGDAKIAGVAVEIVGDRHAEVAAAMEAPPGPFNAFRLDLGQVVLSEVDNERNCMVIRSWRPGGPVVTVER